MASISTKAMNVFQEASRLTFLRDFTDDEVKRMDEMADELRSYLDAVKKREQERINRVAG